jgi:hypothetical protein
MISVTLNLDLSVEEYEVALRLLAMLSDLCPPVRLLPRFARKDCWTCYAAPVHLGSFCDVLAHKLDLEPWVVAATGPQAI